MLQNSCCVNVAELTNTQWRAVTTKISSFTWEKESKREIGSYSNSSAPGWCHQHLEVITWLSKQFSFYLRLSLTHHIHEWWIYNLVSYLEKLGLHLSKNWNWINKDLPSSFWLIWLLFFIFLSVIVSFSC